MFSCASSWKLISAWDILTNRRTWKLQLTAIILKTWGTSCAQDLSGKLGKPWKVMETRDLIPMSTRCGTFIATLLLAQFHTRTVVDEVALEVCRFRRVEWNICRIRVGEAICRSLTTPSFGTQSIDSSLKALGIWTSEKGWRTYGMHHVIYVGFLRFCFGRERFVVYKYHFSAIVYKSSDFLQRHCR